MGLLTQGKPLTWQESQQFIEYVKEHGIIQFLNVYHKCKDRKGDELKWGDEIEYTLVKYDDSKKEVKLGLRAIDILSKLQEEEHRYNVSKEKGENSVVMPKASWKPEYGRFMIEGTPFTPFEANTYALTQVEANMRNRRKEVQAHLQEDEAIVSMTMYPLLGVGEFIVPHNSVNSITRSLFVPDAVINPHPRFGTLTANIRERRGGKVCILMPLAVDSNTNKCVGVKMPDSNECIPIDYRMAQHSPTHYFRNSAIENALKDDILHCESQPDVLLDKPTLCSTPCIYADAMAFGMGCCCLQCTFQCPSLDDARELYDRLIPLCPLLLALTAATPVFRGFLADTDVRWGIISASVDDRTPDEKNVIPKSRYDSVSLYLANSPAAKKYSDIDAPINQKAFKMLLDGGIDEILATHISHLFIRDPLVIFDNCKEIDDNKESDHFENIQSTNWQTVRFKPPPANSPIGWRVEFRVMEVQFNDFENAAFAVFVVLLTRVLLKCNHNMYMPISKVDENMAKAHRRDAVLVEKFFFRKNIEVDWKGITSPEEDALDLYTMNDLINGGNGFEGFMSFIHKYLDTMDCKGPCRIKLNNYLKFVSKRASGELQTNARFIRDFVDQHPHYKHDSKLNQQITYDLLKEIERIESGEIHPEKLLGPKN